MLSIFEKYSAIFKANIDAQLAMSTALQVEALENAAKLADLNMDIANLSLEHLSVARTQLMSATKPQELTALMANHAQPNVEMALYYGRRVVSIASRSHGELTRAAEAQITEIKHKVKTVVDEAVKNAPAGSEHAIALVRSAVGRANARYQRMSNTAYQAADVLEANLSMATSHIAQVVEEKRRRARS